MWEAVLGDVGVTLRVRNLEKSIQFYETITELVISRRFQSGPAEIAFMTNGNGETEIELLYIPQGKTFEGKCSRYVGAFWFGLKLEGTFCILTHGHTNPTGG